MKTFRFGRKIEALTVDSVAIDTDDGGWGTWIAPANDVLDASLSSFRSAIVNYSDFVGKDYGPSETLNFGWNGLRAPIADLYVSPASPEEFSVDYSDRYDTSICVLIDGTLAVTVEVSLRGLEIADEDIEPILRPIIVRNRSELLEVALHGEGNQLLGVVRLRYERRGATVSDAIEFGQTVAALLEALRDGGLDAQSGFDLLISGRPELLLGLQESKWLEVKSQGYDLDSERAKIELAQDVARFANGDEAALLAIGFRTKRRDQEETITKLTPAVHPFQVARYRQTIDGRVFPPVIGLRVEQVELSIAQHDRAGYLLAIFVPAQPEESKPALVHGAIVGGKVEGAFISIVQRRGEHSIPIEAASIHATLAAGRALLRRGQLPAGAGE